MAKSCKAPKPEKNSIQYVRYLLEAEKKEKETLAKRLEQSQKYIETLKKDIAKLTGALEGRFSEEDLKELVAKMAKKRDTSLAMKEKAKKQILNPCPKCGTEMLIIKKFDGSKIYKCLKCRRK